MYLPSLAKAIASTLALSSTVPSASQKLDPSNVDIKARLLQGPSQNCIADPITYKHDCVLWSEAIVQNNLTTAVKELRDAGIFTFLPGGRQAKDINNTTYFEKRGQLDYLFNPKWEQGLAPDEIACQCCDSAKAASCCGYTLLGEEYNACCKREGPRCGYPLVEGGPHTIFCVCWGTEDCIMKGMWPAWVNPACRCDTTCNTG